MTLTPKALYEQVAEQLRQRIFQRELEPGSWIDELKIAEQMATLADVMVLSGKLTMDAETHGPIVKSAVVQQIQAGKFVFSYKLTGDKL